MEIPVPAADRKGLLAAAGERPSGADTGPAHPSAPTEASTLPIPSAEGHPRGRKGPLLTASVLDVMRAAVRAGAAQAECSLDLGRTRVRVSVGIDAWTCDGQRYPYPDRLKDRTIYHWDGEAFAPVSRFAGSLIKLVATDWGPPTFEIDGIKMLPTAELSPYDDAERKVALIEPRGKVVLDTCGGLGYFAAWCLRGGAARVL